MDSSSQRRRARFSVDSSRLWGLFLPLVLLAPQDTVAPETPVVLQFAPLAGTQLNKSFEFQAEFGELEIVVDDHAYSSWANMDLQFLASAVCNDRYVKVGGGRPLELLRSYGHIQGAWEFQRKRTSIPGFDSPSDLAVRFMWRPDPEYYAREFERTTSSTFPLDGLVEDLDLRGFLPTASVVRGERWNPRGKPVMDALFGPTELGLLGIPAELTDETLLRVVFLQPFRECGDKQLEIACEYLGEELSMNPPGAKIRLRLVDKYEIDATSEVNRYLESAFLQNSGWQVRDFFVVWELDGRGDLIWNVAEHRAESLALEADLKLECSFEFQWLSPQDPMQIRLICSGKLQWTMRAERAP